MKWINWFFAILILFLAMFYLFGMYTINLDMVSKKDMFFAVMFLCGALMAAFAMLEEERELKEKIREINMTLEGKLKTFMVFEAREKIQSQLDEPQE